MVKSDLELDLMRYVSYITSVAHVEVMREFPLTLTLTLTLILTLTLNLMSR